MTKPLDVIQAHALVKLVLERSAIYAAIDTQSQVQFPEPLVMTALEIELNRVEVAIKTIVDAHS